MNDDTFTVPDQWHNTYNGQRLTGTQTYDRWHEELMLYLGLDDLFRIATGTEPEPTDTKKLKKYKRRKKAAFKMIWDSVSPNLRFVIPLEGLDPVQALHELKKEFQGSVFEKRIAAVGEFAQLPYSERPEDVSGFVHQFRTRHQRINELDAGVSPKFAFSIFIAGIRQFIPDWVQIQYARGRLHDDAQTEEMLQTLLKEALQAGKLLTNWGSR